MNGSQGKHVRLTVLMLLLIAADALANRAAEFVFDGPAADLGRVYPAWNDARSRYPVSTLRIDGSGGLVGKGSGGFSLPVAVFGNETASLVLDPAAARAGVRVRILLQTHPQSSEYYGWEFTRMAGNRFARRTWFRGARAFKGEPVGHHQLPVDEPLIMSIAAERRGNQVSLRAAAGRPGSKLIELAQYNVGPDNPDGVPLLEGRSPGMLFHHPGGEKVEVRLISAFQANATGDELPWRAADPGPAEVSSPRPSGRRDTGAPGAAGPAMRAGAAAGAGETGIDIIVDDASPGARAIAGRWRRATGASNHHAGMSLYADSGGETDRFRFTPDLPVAGQYEVFAWNSCYPRERFVAHRIVHAGGEETVGVNQDCRGGGTYAEWFSLGLYPFRAGEGQFVEISDAGAGGGTQPYIGADAVRFVLQSVGRAQDGLPREPALQKRPNDVRAIAESPEQEVAADRSGREIVVDDGDAGTVGLGRWSAATGASRHYGDGSVFAEAGGGDDTYLFRQTLPVAGTWRVEAWNSCFSPRHARVPHTIRHASGTATIFVNQDCRTGIAGQWEVLGIYRFDPERAAVVGIGDTGLRSDSRTYIGADAVRFTFVE